MNAVGKDGREQLSLRLDTDLIHEFRVKCAQNRTSMAAVFRAAAEDYELKENKIR